MLPSIARCLRLSAVGLLLLSCTACLEHIEALITKVAYDPYTQVFSIEQRIVGVERRFLGCEDIADCSAAIERAISVQPDPSVSLALGDRLLQRLIESGATDVSVSLERDGDSLDALVRYQAPVGSPAADDTLVRVEWKGRKRGHYYLVVMPQGSTERPRFSRTRKVARSGPSGVDWVEEWVLPRWTRKVSTEMAVGEPNPIFAELPALADVLEANGWLGDRPARPADTNVAEAETDEPETDEPETDEPETDEPETDVADVEPPEPEASPAPRPAPVRRPEPAVTPARISLPQGSGAEAIPVALDPTSPAKTWFYPARISGGGLTEAAAALSLEPLVPAISRCYQSRQREAPSLEGSVFLSALVRADGEVVATSVHGSLGDPTMLACLDRIIEGWTFPSWGGDGVSDVAVPVVFRLEKGGPGHR